MLLLYLISCAHRLSDNIVNQIKNNSMKTVLNGVILLALKYDVSDSKTFSAVSYM